MGHTDRRETNVATRAKLVIGCRLVSLDLEMQETESTHRGGIISTKRGRGGRIAIPNRLKSRLASVYSQNSSRQYGISSKKVHNPTVGEEPIRRSVVVS